MTKKPQINVFIGRTAGGFNKFLKENELNPIEPEALAGFVVRGFKNFANKDREASNVLLNEIWELVGAKDGEMAYEVTSQFGKLCDFYKTVLDSLVEDAKH